MHKHQSSGDLIADRRFSYATALLAEGNHAGAIDLFQQTLELAPHWPACWFALGEAYEKSSQTKDAIKAFKTCLSLSKTDTLGAGVRLLRLGVATSEPMTPAYVSALFDQYAGRFDEHLTKALLYQGPEIILDALKSASKIQGRAFQFATAVDLGCGTGLMARALGSTYGTILGVDLSPAMVIIAQKTGLYQSVVVGDLMDTLRAIAQPVALIVAADVFVYMGDLAPVFSAAKNVLATHGLFAFTVQSYAGSGFIIGDDLRYHHSENHIREATERAGLAIISLAPCITRHDAGKPVAGFVIVLNHADKTSEG